MLRVSSSRKLAMSIHVYEVRPRKDHRGVDLISDALPFGRLWNCARIVFDCRMANDQANMSSTIPEFLVWPMKNELRLITAVVIALALVSSAVAEAAPSRPMDEDAAVALLVRTLKHDRVYANRISLGCLTYDTEETTNAYFQFALREKHDAKCGGDPETSPVVARYRVYRRSGKIDRWQPTDDSWHRYDPAKIK